MRIVVVGALPPSKGGIETFLVAYIDALVKRGHQVIAISNSETESVSNLGAARVHKFPITRPVADNAIDEIAEASRKISNVISDFSPDVLHFHPSGYEILLMRFALRPFKHLPVIVTLHAAYFSNQMISASPDMATLTAVSRFVAKSCSEYDKDVRVIENALPPVAEMGEFASTPTVFALGRLLKEKGFDTLIEAQGLVRKQMPDAMLVIAGLGPEYKALHEKAKNVLGERQAYEMPGWLDPRARAQAYQASQVVVVPSRWEEPFGLVALEAAQHARPVVVTNSGELPNLVSAGATGLVVPVDDPQSMADAILKLLSDPVAAQKMGQTARAFATKRFDFERMMDRYEAVLHEAAGL